MSRIDELALQLAAKRSGEIVTVPGRNDRSLVSASDVPLSPKPVTSAPAQTVGTVTTAVTATKARWGSIIPALLGAATAVPTANTLLPEHIVAGMGFWEFAAWTVLQAGIFAGLTFLNIWSSPPNLPK